MTSPDPHADEPVRTAGLETQETAATVVLVHGRGASAKSILAVFSELGVDNHSSRVYQVNRMVNFAVDRQFVR